MAYLREENKWDSPIYLIERHDPVMGGEYGINNIQARQLADRTLYLLTRILKEHSGDGTHLFTEAEVNTLAGIVESKLALDYGTGGIYAACLAAQGILRSISQTLDAAEGLEGTSLKTIYDALMISWRYGYPRFTFEMFMPRITLMDIFEPVPLEETISGDDSIDVIDSSTLHIGETYVIWDKEQNSAKMVTVKDILTDRRVILYEVERKTRANTGVLTKSSWDIVEGLATTFPGSVYITGTLPLLDGYERGNFLISHKDPASFTVEYRSADAENPTVWYPTPLVRTWYSEKRGAWRSVFEVPGGTLVFKVTANDATFIDHMALMTDTWGVLSSLVRTPKIMGGDFRVERFGALYGGECSKIEVQLSENTDFINEVTTVELPVAFEGREDPVWHLRDAVLAAHPMTAGTEVFWRVRYTAVEGVSHEPLGITGVSAWSQISSYIVE